MAFHLELCPVEGARVLTDRQTDIQRYRHTDIQTDRQTEDRTTDRQTNRQTDRHRLKDRQTDRWLTNLWYFWVDLVVMHVIQ